MKTGRYSLVLLRTNGVIDRSSTEGDCSVGWSPSSFVNTEGSVVNIDITWLIFELFVKDNAGIAGIVLFELMKGREERIDIGFGSDMEIYLDIGEIIVTG